MWRHRCRPRICLARSLRCAVFSTLLLCRAVRPRRYTARRASRPTLGAPPSAKVANSVTCLVFPLKLGNANGRPAMDIKAASAKTQPSGSTAGRNQGASDETALSLFETQGIKSVLATMRRRNTEGSWLTSPKVPRTALATASTARASLGFRRDTYVLLSTRKVGSAQYRHYRDMVKFSDILFTAGRSSSKI